MDWLNLGAIGHVLLGVVLMQVMKWFAGWIDGKGVELVQDELKKLQTKLNENSVLGQIKADDALIEICEHALPVVINTLSEEVQKDLADGKFDSVSWQHIGAQIWQHAKEQVHGGVNDYLKSSSFEDGTKVAAMVAERFFHLQLAQKKGTVTAPPQDAGGKA